MSANAGRDQRARKTDDRDLQQFGDRAADKGPGDADEDVGENAMV